MTAMFSRRQFVFAVGGSLAARSLRVSAQATLTAAAVVDRIKRQVADRHFRHERFKPCGDRAQFGLFAHRVEQ